MVGEYQDGEKENQDRQNENIQKGNERKTWARTSRGSIHLKTGATTENLHFLLLIVCRPIIGRDYFEEFSYSFHFIVHAICVVCIYKKALLLTCLSHP